MCKWDRCHQHHSAVRASDPRSASTHAWWSRLSYIHQSPERILIHRLCTEITIVWCASRDMRVSIGASARVAHSMRFSGSMLAAPPLRCCILPSIHPCRGTFHPATSAACSIARPLKILETLAGVIECRRMARIHAWTTWRRFARRSAHHPSACHRGMGPTARRPILIRARRITTCPPACGHAHIGLSVRDGQSDTRSRKESFFLRSPPERSRMSPLEPTCEPMR
jgi:hypothetical protein